VLDENSKTGERDRICHGTYYFTNGEISQLETKRI
jgi:hypothetical protein